MKILLVKPYNLSDHIQPSLGLGYLATAVRNKSEVRILDCIKENIKANRFGAFIKDYRPDVVGFQCYTFDLDFVKKMLEIVKGIDRHILTLVGGAHPSALPEGTMRFFGDNLNFAFRGESENSLSSFIELLNGKSINFSDIPGLVWRKNGSIESNNYFFEDNLDNFGMPSWDLIRPETYPESQHGAFYKKFPIAPIMLTRGCPYRCTFCAGKIVTGRKLRKRSIPNVINEIKILYRDYGIREFHIIDDNFTLDKAYAKSFLKEVIGLGLDICFATPNGLRIETLDEELLFLMKRSGVYLISIGIESGSDRVLKLMKKGLNVEKTKKMVRLIRDHKFDIAGFFIIGFPGENRDDIMKTIKLSLELDLIRANYFTYLPFPGTESYDELEKNGELKNVDWNRFYFMNAAYTPNGITRRDLKSLQRRAFAKFYLRPRILWKNLIEIKSFRHFWFLAKRFFRWIVLN